MYDQILTQIDLCLDTLSKLNESCQIYIEAHDKYIENNIRDADILKKKMKEKVVRVIHEE